MEFLCRNLNVYLTPLWEVQPRKMSILKRQKKKKHVQFEFRAVHKKTGSLFAEIRGE